MTGSVSKADIPPFLNQFRLACRIYYTRKLEAKQGESRLSTVIFSINSLLLFKIAKYMLWCDREFICREI